MLKCKYFAIAAITVFILFPQKTQANSFNANSINNTINNVNSWKNTINNIENTWINYLPDSVAELFRDLEKIVGEIDTFMTELGINIQTGEIGLPDIQEAINIFETDLDLDRGSDIFGTQTGSTNTISTNLYRQFLRDVGNEYAQNSALSLEGQDKTAEQIEIAQEKAEISNKLAQNSNTQDVSQNILRNISNQLALQQQQDNMQFFAAEEDKVARSLNLAMQGELLSSIDSLNVRGDRERISTYQNSQYYHALMSVPLQHLIK